MKNPIQWVLFSGGGCTLLAALLFGAGIAFDLPTSKLAGKWLWFAAILIVFIPLMSLAVATLFEKLRGK
jgi:hypothetical protein